MATFEATIPAVTFANMESEVKTVHVVPRTTAYDMVTSGDRFEFEPLGSMTVGAIRRYDSLTELLEAEGFQNVVPEADTLEAAVEAVRSSPEWNRRVEDAQGVIALRVRSTKRKT